MERWFDLEDIEGRPSGTVLLRLAFRPFAAEEELLESPRKARERVGYTVHLSVHRTCYPRPP